VSSVYDGLHKLEPRLPIREGLMYPGRKQPMTLDVPPQKYAHMTHALSGLGTVMILYVLIKPPDAYAYMRAPSGCQSPPCSFQGKGDYPYILRSNFGMDSNYKGVEDPENSGGRHEQGRFFAPNVQRSPRTWWHPYALKIAYTPTRYTCTCRDCITRATIRGGTCS
jgi:hypothetical protein